MRKQTKASASLIWFATIAFVLLLSTIPKLGQTTNYARLVSGVKVGMDTLQVLSHTGEPTRKQDVARWYYGNDQAVLHNERIIDIRLGRRSGQPILNQIDNHDSTEGARAIANLRIGMSPDEVEDTAGEPDRKEAGQDWYYTNRHRIEISENEVVSVSTHIKAGLEILDWIRLNFSKGGLLFMNITLAFIMFGVALEIKTVHFKSIAKKPKTVVVGFISQFLLLPALTFGLVLIIRPSPSVAMGMILVAACPGGNISNFISSLAKGNVALSISLTAIATIGAIIFTPLNFAFWGSLYSEAAELVIPIRIDPWEMLKTVLILLGIPITVGIWFNHRFPKLTLRIIKPIKYLSIVIFIGFIAAALASNFGFFLSYIHLIALIVLAHNLIALATGFSFASLMGLSGMDRRSITIETGIQNSGLGLVLIFNPQLFNGLGGMAFIAAWWGIWHIIAGLAIATIWAHRPLKS